MSRFTLWCLAALFFCASSSAWSQLNSSTSSSSTGNYTLSWSSTGSIWITESKDGGAPSQIYSGAGSSYGVNGRSSGTYEYNLFKDVCTFICAPSLLGSVTVTVSLPSVPSTPGNISGPSTASNGSYSLSWSASTGAPVSGYQLQERLNGGSWSMVQNTTSRSRSFTKDANRYYDYRVRACNGGHCSSYTPTKRVTIPNGTVDASASTTALAYTTDSFTVNWSSALTTSCSGSGISISGTSGSKSVSLSGWTYNSTGMTYSNSFQVSCSVKGGGTVSKTVQMSAVSVPPRPTVNVSWNKSSMYIGESATFSWSTSDTNSCTLDGGSAGTSGSNSYSYNSPGNKSRNVTCTNAQGSTSKSASVLVSVGTPGAISGPSTASNGSYTLTWGDAPGSQTRYELYERLNGSGNWERVHNSSSRSKSLSQTANRYYDYRVRACYNSYCGNYTSTKRVTIPAASINISTSPSQLSRTDSTFTLNWSSVMTSSCSWNAGSISGASGSKSFGLPTGWTYSSGAWRKSTRITCDINNSSSTVSKDFTIVASAQQPLPSINVSWQSGNRYVGQSVTLEWSSSEANACRIGSTSVGTSGTRNFTYSSPGTYSETVTCENERGTTNQSASVSVNYTMPGVPGAISGPSSAGSGQYTLSWGASTGDLTAYDLLERVNSGSWSVVYTGTTRSRSFAKSSGANYEYRVRACNHGVCSNYSPTKTVNVPVPSINISTSPSQLSRTDSTFTLNWSSVMTSGCSWDTGSISGASGSKSFRLPSGWTYSSGAWRKATRITCNINNSSSTVAKDFTIVASAQQPLPTVNVSWQSGSRYVGQPVILEWSSSEANSCRIGSTSVGTSGTRQFTYNSSGSHTETVTCENERGSTNESANVSVAYTRPGVPGAIDGLSIANDGEYTLSWGTASGTLTTYQLQERVNYGSWASVQNNTLRSRGFTKTLGDVSVYDYRVRACNHNACSNFTETKRVTTPAAVDFSGTPSPAAFTQPEHDEAVGALGGERSINPDGSASYTIPITTPAGRAGMEPSISVSYNSSNSADGELGLGWTVSGFSKIQRCTTSKARGEEVDPVDFDENDKYCLDGQRLVLVDGIYGDDGAEYRLENDSFLKVVSVDTTGNGPTSFMVYTPEGLIQHYGETENSRINASNEDGTGNRIEYSTWALSSVRDQHDNRYDVTYEKPDGTFNYRPLKIDYTRQSTSEVAPHSVRFEYNEDRPDTSIAFMGGSRVKLTWTLSNIKTFNIDPSAQETLVREYRFDYKSQSHHHYPTQLSSVTECATGNVCLPATEFTWSAQDHGVSKLEADGVWADLYGNWSDGTARTNILDLDRDGFSEVVMGPDGTGNWFVLKNPNGEGFVDGGMWASNAFGEYDQRADDINVADMDGDGDTDFLFGPNAQGNWYVLRNLGDEFDDTEAGKQPWATGAFGEYATAESRVRVADMTGDGLPDVLLGPKSSGEWSLLRNTGSSLVKDADHIWASNAYGDWYTANDRIFLQDMDGDGLTDVLIGPKSNGNWYVLRNTGSSLVDEGLWATGEYGEFHDNTDRINVADLNGDNLPDVLMGPRSDGDWFVLLNTGKGFIDDGVWAVDAYGDWYDDTGPSKTRVVDMDDDGLNDVVLGPNEHGYWYILKNTGTSLVAYSSLGTGYPEFSGEPARVNFGDLTGDGFPEVLLGPKSSGEWYVMKNLHTKNLMTEVTNGMGHKTTFVYAPLTDGSVYTKGTGAQYPVNDAMGPMYVVKEEKGSNGTGTGEFRSTYKYEAARMHVNGYGSLGFEKVTVRNENTNIETTTHFSQDYQNRTQLMPLRIETRANNGTVLSLTENEWVTYTSNDATTWSVVNPSTEYTGDARRFRTQVERTEVTKRDLNGEFLHRDVTESQYDIHGFPTLITTRLYDEVGTLIRTKTTDSEYTAADYTNWHLPLVDKMTVTVDVHALNDPITTVTAWSYNDDRQKISERILIPGTDTALSEKHHEDFDIFGNSRRTRITGPNFETRTSSKVFDETGRFVTSVTNSLGHTASTTYYPADSIHAGLVNVSTDANGIQAKHYYDVFGRLIEQVAFYGTAKAVSSYTSFQWCDDVFDENACVDLDGARPKYRITASSEGGAGSHAYIDMLGREVKKSSQSIDGKFVETDTLFDANGRKQYVVEPHFAGDYEYIAEFVYDDLGRVTEATESHGVVNTITYNGLSRTHTTDIHNKNQSKMELRDVMDNLIEVIDNNQVSSYYKYNGVGNLIELTVNNRADTTMTVSYDALGRKIAMNDPDKGAWSYTYNGLGELVTQTNARGETTCNVYDLGGRLVRRYDYYQGSTSNVIGASSNATSQCANPGGASTHSLWQYDTASGKSLGKLHYSRKQDNSFQSTNRYDAIYGYPISVTQSIDGVSYETNTEYDNLHRVAAIEYPGASNRLKITTAYNQLGFATLTRNAHTDETYYAIYEVDAHGNALEEIYGNGVKTVREFDQATSRIDTIKSYSPIDFASASIQNLEFSFEDIGNLIYRNDAIQNIEEDFTYDSLNRLTTNEANFGNDDIRTTTVIYDELGNIRSKSGVGSYSYGETCNNHQAGPHAVTSITAPKLTNYCYDANGNMISGDGRTIEYTSFDKPNVISKGETITSTIAYNPDRTRYKRIDEKDSLTTTYHYVGGIYEHVTLPTNKVEERHYIGGFAVLTIKDRTATEAGSMERQYLHKDHIGSNTVITDGAGTPIEKFSFDPWGKRRAVSLDDLETRLGSWSSLAPDEKANLTISSSLLASSITNRGFTGHEQMDDVGLVHMNGRVYDAEIGRFISADPHVQDARDIQALNRYSYVQNNPLSYTDPTGYFLETLEKKLRTAIEGIERELGSGLRSIGRQLNKYPALANVIGIVLTAIDLGIGATYFKYLAALKAAIAVANGAQPGRVLKGVAIAYVTGDLVTWSVGDHLVSSMLAGGIAAKASGGKFADGVKSAAVSFGTKWVAGKLAPKAKSDELVEGQGEQGEDTADYNDTLNELDERFGGHVSPKPVEVSGGEFDAIATVEMSGIDKVAGYLKTALGREDEGDSSFRRRWRGHSGVRVTDGPLAGKYTRVSDLNYFFQGAIAAAYNKPKIVMDILIVGYNLVDSTGYDLYSGKMSFSFGNFFKEIRQIPTALLVAHKGYDYYNDRIGK